MKKLALVLVLVLAFALPVLANPFVDVPLNHWAYDSVQSLAAKGVIVGYPDGTFGGAKSLTRYEFAEATAKALAYVEGMDFASADDVAILEKLAIEFADELASLGVTVADLEAALGANSEAIAVLETTVAKHETFFEPVKITGSFTATYELPSDTGIGTLSDETEFDIVATINDKTTAGITVTITDTLTGAPAATAVVWDDFFIDYQGDNAQLRFGDVEPATIALGLIYDSAEFEGALMTWNMFCTDFTAFTRVDDFYTMNADWVTDWGSIGATASWDRLIPDYVVGADMAVDVTDCITFEAEGAYQVTANTYAVATEATVACGDLTFVFDAWYIRPGFEPTMMKTGTLNLKPTSYSYWYVADSLGGVVKVSYQFSDALVGELEYYNDNTIALAPVASVGDAGLVYTFDADTGEAADVSFGYDLLTNGYVAYAGYNDYPLTDDLKASASYQYTSLIAEHTGVLTLNYTYSEVLSVQLDGRYDSVPAAGAPVYSAEIALTHALAENTELTVGYELNAWDGDDKLVNSRDILDNVGTLSAELSVTF